MLVKVTLEKIIIDQENTKIRKDDIKIEDTRITISTGAFKELEMIFAMIRKGYDDFKGDFQFKSNV